MRRKRLLLPALAVGLVLGMQAAGVSETAAAACASYGTTVTRPTAARVVDETSGVVVSYADPTVLYAHDDSVGENWLAVVDKNTGATVAKWTVPAAGLPFVTQWEDIGIGPCANNGTLTCVYVGAIGYSPYPYFYVTYFVEPSHPRAGGTVTAPVRVLKFTYDKPVLNSESLVVGPSCSDRPATVYLIEKPVGTVNVPARVFRLTPAQLKNDATTNNSGPVDTASYVTTMRWHPYWPFTGADVNHCANRMLLRNDGAPGHGDYSMVYWIDNTTGLFESFFTTPSFTGKKFVDEKQGEAVAFDATGAGFFTLSEGSGQHLTFTPCT